MLKETQVNQSQIMHMSNSQEEKRERETEMYDLPRYNVFTLTVIFIPFLLPFSFNWAKS